MIVARVRGVTPVGVGIHSAANLFPLDQEHLDELVADIKANGQQVAEHRREKDALRRSRSNAASRNAEDTTDSPVVNEHLEV